jgi:hypothetical protein
MNIDHLGQSNVVSQQQSSSRRYACCRKCGEFKFNCNTIFQVSSITQLRKENEVELLIYRSIAEANPERCRIGMYSEMVDQQKVIGLLERD